MTKLTRAQARDIQQELRLAAEKIATKHGLSLAKTTARFDSGFRTVINMVAVHPDNGKEFIWNDQTYIFIRKDTRKRKYPILVQKSSDGKTYKLALTPSVNMALTLHGIKP